MSVKYQIEVPGKQIAKDVNNKTHDLSIEPKYNRKIILTCQNDVTGSEKKPYLHFKVTPSPASGDYTPAYPEGDKINITPGIGEYTLKDMWIFNGLYNDYIQYPSFNNNDDYKEVLLVHEKTMGPDTHYLYVFFLMSTKSDGGDENENTFFDVWKNMSTLEIKEPPRKDQPYTTTGVLDIIPRTTKVHIWKDLTRQLNNNLIVPENIKDAGGGGGKPYSNVMAIIVNPETYTSKKIPVDNPPAGEKSVYGEKLFGEAEKYNVNFDCTSEATSAPESTCSMKQIKTIANRETQRYGSSNGKTLSLNWKAIGNTIAVGQDTTKAINPVYFSSGLQDYWYSSNTFMKAFAGGGSGTVLTTCVEVEQKVAEGDEKKDKSISSYEEKHMLPEGKTWYGWDRRPGAKGEDAAAARLAFEKSFYPGPIDQFDKHYMFYILLFLGVAIILVIIVYFILHYKNKVIPAAMKAKGMKVS